MSEEIKTELKQCSRCHSTVTLEHYEKNRKGEWFKLCNNCRHRNAKEKQEYRESKGETYREKERQYAKQYRKENPDKIEEYQKYWIDKHIDKYKDELDAIKECFYKDIENIDVKQLLPHLFQRLKL